MAVTLLSFVSLVLLFGLVFLWRAASSIGSASFPWLVRVLALVIFGPPLNFALFGLVSAIIGGNADPGETQAGRFYVVSHGHYTEVSKQVFTYSLWHEQISLWLNTCWPWFLGAIAVLFVVSRFYCRFFADKP